MWDHDHIEWKRIALTGSLAEELADETREREWLLKELEPENDTGGDDEP